MTSVRFELHGPLNTVTDVRGVGASRTDTDEVESFVMAELSRLESVFSVFDTKSELSRWRMGEVARPSQELTHVLAEALVWQQRSAGVFNPLVGELTMLWARAENEQCLPDDEAVDSATRAIAGPRFRIGSDGPIQIGDCSNIDLNAIAKGFIVDLVTEKTFSEFEFDQLTVNVGGDARRLGAGSSPIGIENPLRPYDNEPPLTVVELTAGAIATSGPSRRGFKIGGERFSHVIDPRSGWPANGPAGVSIAANNACTADVVATVASVLDPASAVEWVARQDGVAGLVIGNDGEVTATPGWIDRFGGFKRA